MGHKLSEHVWKFIYIKLNVSLLSCIGAHTIHQIAMKLSQAVINMFAVVLEFKKCTSWSTRFCSTFQS